MSAEFIDTNILVYASDSGSGRKHPIALDLVSRLARRNAGALSTQVLAEYYNTATKKLRMSSEEAEETIRDLAGWHIHRTSHSDILRSIELQRRWRLSWWDSMIVNSAIQSGASVLWTEDLSDGQEFGSLVVRNPFA